MFRREGENIMTAEHYPFSVCIQNLGAYNEGTLRFKRIDFPTNVKKIEAALREIGIGEPSEDGTNYYEEIMITNYDDYTGLGICREYGEWASLSELNYLATLLNNMKNNERVAFEGALEIEGTNNPADYINLALNVDKFTVFSEIEDAYDYGEYYVENELDMDSVPSIVRNNIDYEAVGETISSNENGVFTDENYVIKTQSIDCLYESREDIPEKYIVNLNPQEIYDNFLKDKNEKEMEL